MSRSQLFRWGIKSKEKNIRALDMPPDSLYLPDISWLICSVDLLMRCIAAPAFCAYDASHVMQPWAAEAVCFGLESWSRGSLVARVSCCCMFLSLSFCLIHYQYKTTPFICEYARLCLKLWRSLKNTLQCLCCTSVFVRTESVFHTFFESEGVLS